MDAKELRIGNYVFLKDGKDMPASITGVWGNRIKFGWQSLWSTTQENVYPIPLTPEILIACGFQKFDDENVREQFVAKDFNGHNWLWLEQNHGEVYGNYWPSNVGTEGYTAFSLVPITSLHQLQNLYFALTGEELTYTPIIKEN